MTAIVVARATMGRISGSGTGTGVSTDSCVPASVKLDGEAYDIPSVTKNVSFSTVANSTSSLDFCEVNWPISLTRALYVSMLSISPCASKVVELIYDAPKSIP